MTWTSGHKNQQEKVLWDWHYSFLLSHPHEKGPFWPFFTMQSQVIKQTTTLLFILNILCCKNNLMQKMTSITPSIHKIIHLKIFFKNLASLTTFMVLGIPTKGPVHLELFCPFASEVCDYIHQIILAPPNFQTFRRP